MRKIKKNYRHITGEVNIDGKTSLPFEGPIERHFYALMGSQRLIDSISVQSETIEYENSKGRKTRYTPEAVIRFRDAAATRPILVEVKSREDLRNNWADWEERFRVAINYARDRGWLFRIYTDVEVRTPYLQTLLSLRLHRTHHFSVADQDAVVQIVLDNPGISFGEALAAIKPCFSGDVGENLSRLYHVISIGKISANLFRPIDYQTRLDPAGTWLEKPWSRSWLRSATPPKKKQMRAW